MNFYLSSEVNEHFCFVRRIGEYIFLDLFCFVSLTSSCPLIPRLERALHHCVISP